MSLDIDLSELALRLAAIPPRPPMTTCEALAQVAHTSHDERTRRAARRELARRRR